MLRLIFVFGAVFISLSCPAYADCTSPAGKASQTRYDSGQNKLLYCNDTAWVEMGGDGILSTLSCTSNQVAKWNGSAWVCAADNAGSGDNLGNHSATNHLDMNTRRITDLGAPSGNADAATKQYVDNAVSGGSTGECRATAAQYNGNLGGLSGADALCVGEFGAGWRMARDIHPEAVAGTFRSPQKKWVNNTLSTADCGDWTSNNNGLSGHYLGGGSGIVSTTQNCSSTALVLCCNM